MKSAKNNKNIKKNIMVLKQIEQLKAWRIVNELPR